MKTAEEKRAYNRAWRLANPEKVKAQKAAWEARNPDKIKQYKRDAWARDPAGNAAKSRENYQANRDLYCERLRAKRVEDGDAIRQKAREYNARNRQKMVPQARAYRKQNRAAFHLYDVRKRSKRGGLAFDLTIEWVESRLAGCCEMTGLPFDLDGCRTAHSPSIDRINPKGGYTQANCRMIVWSLNRAMSDYGDEYLIGLIKLVIERRGG